MSRAESSQGPTSSADQAFVGSDAHLGVVRIRGEHDIATVSVLAATLSQTVAAEGADVVVDLSEVEFMAATPVSGPSGALGTWAAVPATERAKRHDEAVDGMCHGANVPVAPAPAADSLRRETDATAEHGAP